MKVFTFVIGAILSTLVAGNAALKEDIYDILKVRSWSPAIKPRSGLQARACLATCNNGGCCNTGGPCTTDGMCCQTGEFACTDGGCCQIGETCGTSNGTQVCQSNTGCTAPPVTCGSSCCDAGMVCVKVGTNLRCEAASTTATSTSKVSVTTPVLGDSLPKNSTFSRPTTTANLSAFTSQSVIKVTTSQAISPSSTAAAAATTSSKSSSSALRQSLSVSELQGMMSLIAGVAVAVVLVMVN